MKTKEPSKIQRETTTTESNHHGVLHKKQADNTETMMKNRDNKIYIPSYFLPSFSDTECSQSVSVLTQRSKHSNLYFFCLLNVVCVCVWKKITTKENQPFVMSPWGTNTFP